MSKRFRKRLALLVIGGLAALILGSAIDARADVWTKLVGDTASLITRTAYDTTFKSSFDCCLLTVSSPADTTRPFDVMGAQWVGMKVASGDTSNAFRVHVTGFQVSDDSTNWTGLNLGATANSDFLVNVDTTLITLATTLTRSGTAGWARELRFYPTTDYDVTGGGLELNGGAFPRMFTFRWVRIIFTRSLLAPAGPGKPAGLRVQAYAIRNDLGEQMRRRSWGP